MATEHAGLRARWTPHPRWTPRPRPNTVIPAPFLSQAPAERGQLQSEATGGHTHRAASSLHRVLNPVSWPCPLTLPPPQTLLFCVSPPTPAPPRPLQCPRSLSRQPTAQVRRPTLLQGSPGAAGSRSPSGASGTSRRFSRRFPEEELGSRRLTVRCPGHLAVPGPHWPVLVGPSTDLGKPGSSISEGIDQKHRNHTGGKGSKGWFGRQTFGREVV